MRAALTDALIEAAAGRYRAAGRFAFHYARAKLRHDPVYAAILREGLIPSGSRVLDLGCGQGILLAALLAAQARSSRESWPAGWKAAPAGLRLRGIDLRPDAIRRAGAALGGDVALEQADVSQTALPRSDAIVLLDVLHYLGPAAQEAVLAAAAQAAAPGGHLVLRVADARDRTRARITLAADRVGAWLRGERWGDYHLRPLPEWIALLEVRGFAARAVPIGGRTMFANVLLVAERP
ncbi:MAG TPA: class I SAM-dependent methyltransferase [Burkholderiales bacterium]|nr:class I SAM-dependent methyltransferase [Burkholderiales bacterium]